MGESSRYRVALHELPCHPLAATLEHGIKTWRQIGPRWQIDTLGWVFAGLESSLDTNMNDHLANLADKQYI